jgi:flagellar hook assembly protein FlgD
VITFDLPIAQKVEFEIVNILGEVVYSFDRHYPGGWHQIDWNGKDNSGLPVASGVYYYRLETSEYSDSKKMILLK